MCSVALSLLATEDALATILEKDIRMKTSSEFKFAFPTIIINFNTHRITELGGNSSIGPADEDRFYKFCKLTIDSMKERRDEYDERRPRP